MSWEELRRQAEGSPRGYIAVPSRDVISLLDAYEQAVKLLGEVVVGRHSDLVDAARAAVKGAEL